MSEKMSKNRIAKEAQVAEIVEKIKASQSVTFVSYSGLTVEQVTNLRKQCREANVQYCVLKNRLFGLALKECGITDVEASLLEGPNAFVFSTDDAVIGPKTVSTFVEKNKLENVLQIRGGLLEGKAADKATMLKLATMPSREVLLARLVGSMSATIGNFVRVVEAFRKKQAGEE